MASPITTTSPDLTVAISACSVPAFSLTFNAVTVMVPVLGKPDVNTSPEDAVEPGAFVGAGVAVGAAAGLMYWLLT